MNRSMYVETPIHIRAYEIDAMGIVSNIVYVKWFEDLRHLLLDKYYPYEDMMLEQKSPILLKTEAMYKKSLTIQDKVFGKAWFSAMGNIKWEITLEIWSGETLHCLGKQTGGYYDMAKQRPVAFPDWFAGIYNQGLQGNDIYCPSEHEYDEITDVWEASVRATHTFITEEDVNFYRPLVRNHALPAADLRCVKNKEGRIIAFLGIENNKLEMLFIHPDQRGNGLGKFLTDYAIGCKKVNLVDVNEQNDQAVGFYKHMGFEVISRDEPDGSGKPFPILRMQLKPDKRL